MQTFFEKNKIRTSLRENLFTRLTLVICISIIIGAFIIGGFIYLSSQSESLLKKESPDLSFQENKIQATASQSIQEKILPPSTTTNTGIVDYVVDGDTVKLRSGEAVRLVGINAPETGQPYSSEAKNKLKELIEGKEVALEKDITDKDQYGRLLRYVWLDNVFVNLEMVKQGYANSYTYPPDVKYREQIIAAEKQAREAKIGLWAPAQTSNSIIVSYMHADAQGNDNYNLNNEYVIFKNTSAEPINMSGWTAKDEATHIFTFPSFYFAPNATLTLYSGSGTNTTDRLYWNRADEKYAIWNNNGDVVYLRDANGGLVLEYKY